MNNKWWLISDESVNEIRELINYISNKHLLSFGVLAEKLSIKLMHELDSGLHTTDAIPSDYEKVELRGYDDKLFDVNKDDLVNDDLGNAELSERVSKDITDIVLGKLGKNN